MNFQDAKVLLTNIVAYDRRKGVDAMVVEVWMDALENYTLAECQWALRYFIRNNTDEWLKPGHLAQIVRQKREEYRMMNPARHLTGDEWLEFEAMVALASEHNRIIQATATRSAVEAMESGEFDA